MRKKAFSIVVGGITVAAVLAIWWISSARPDFHLSPAEMESLGKPAKGMELKIQLSRHSVGELPRSPDDIVVKVVVKNGSDQGMCYGDDTFARGPIVVFYGLKSKGVAAPLTSPEPLAVGIGLRKLAPGATVEYEEKISGRFLSAILSGGVICRLGFFEAKGEKPWTGPQFTVWSNVARLDLAAAPDPVWSAWRIWLLGPAPAVVHR